MLDEKRKGRITASSVGAILGCAPYATRADVMRRMIREHHGLPSEFTGNIATEYGNTNEPNALFDFELKTGFDVKGAGFFIAEHADYLGATPDGLLWDHAILEIKCPYGLRGCKDEKQFKTLTEQPHYYAQVQMQLYCTGREVAYFYQWTPYCDKIDIAEVDDEWRDKNLPLIFDFWLEYRERIDENCDFWLNDSIETEGAKIAAQNYRNAKKVLEEAQAHLDACKAAIIEIDDGRKCNVSGLSVYRVEREGSVSYAKAIKDIAPGVDLSLYKGAPSSHWVIK
jgi:putative phage-type endonuclease